jgi:hypothetical protein
MKSKILDYVKKFLFVPLNVENDRIIRAVRNVKNNRNA